MSRFNLICVGLLAAYMLAVVSVDGGPVKRSAHYHDYDELGRPLGYEHPGSQGFGGYGGYGGQGDLRNGHRDLINHHEDLRSGNRGLVNHHEDLVRHEDSRVNPILQALGGHRDLVHQGDLMRGHGEYPFGGYGVGDRGGLGGGFVPDGHHVY